MLKKTITYEDFEGVKRTETFHFNLSRSEITEMEVTTPGGFGAKLEAIVGAQDKPTLFRLWKEIILLSYGERIEEGRSFRKSEEMSTAFSHTAAYDKIFMELVTDADAATAFVNGIVPKEIAQPNKN